MEGKATVDEKPIGVRTGDTKPRSRTTTTVPQMGHLLAGFPGGPYGFLPPYMQPNLGYPMGNFGCYPPNQPLENPISNFGQYYDPNQPSRTHPHDPTPTSSPSTSSSPPLPPTDIISWFSSLDLNEQWNADGVTFAPFGHMLAKKGFVRISQLTPTFVKLQDLQVWLGIEVGTAILIMQYAEEDWNAVRSGAHA
ncbi:hypothetical protein M404DRAFT_971623 [Pisolithus tinctorius Marx 270]|uniref:Uncharacterized protein n=1 Tax=Pisolithus tinctorius Marx 270 TaxID=870435 RepID=A0A0C3PPP3_PISTI|nr:hypothetical protein M404DRAFT_971623 [Pisolithus tinctorius Marx 270]